MDLNKDNYKGFLEVFSGKYAIAGRFFLSFIQLIFFGEISLRQMLNST